MTSLKCLSIVVIVALIIVIVVYFITKTSKGGFTKTNYDMCVGKEGIVTEKISNINATGQVRVNGQIWSAKSEDDSEIEVDTIVIAEKIDGVKLIVRKKVE